MKLEYEDLTRKIIASAIEVQKQLGPGFLESIYENAMLLQLRKAGFTVDHQLDPPVYFDGVEVGRHRLDLLVENTIVVELKAIKNVEDIHLAVVRSYLKAARKQHGLLINFAKLPLEIRRVIYSAPLQPKVEYVIQ